MHQCERQRASRSSGERYVEEVGSESMTSRLLIIILVFTLTPIQAGRSVLNVQVGQEVSDAQKREFIELLKTLPFKGEFYTEEGARKAAPYLPVLFSLTEKDVEKYDLYAFVAISVGICQDKERRVYAVAHFAEIRHPKLKLFWAALLFNLKEVSPEIVRYLRDALDSSSQAQELREMVGPDFKFFKRDVRNHPFAQDGRQSSNPPSEEDEGHADWVSSVAFSPDGKTLLSGSHDGTLILWDVVTGRQLRSIEGHRQHDRPFAVLSVAFSPDGKMLLSASEDNTLRLWDASTGAELRVFREADFSHEAVFSPDGKMIAAANCGSLVLLDALTGRLLRTFRRTVNCVTHVAFSPDGRTLLNDGGLIQVRDLSKGRVVKSFGLYATLNGMALSLDGRTLLLGGKTPELWDVVRGRLLRRFPEQPNSVEAVAFSPDGKVMASEIQEGIRIVYRLSSSPRMDSGWPLAVGITRSNCGMSVAARRFGVFPP
jgi:WD domain, G-beta repeat